MKLIKRKLYAKPLKREAILYIGLPDNYDQAKEAYPVLYMQDGHNVFLKEDSFSGETWQVLELYELNHHLKDMIVVALNASNKENGRLYEYGPYPFKFPLDQPTNVGGGGDVYVDYLVHTIKPMIDYEFRTLKDNQNTSIMGSSMGGLIALYAGLKYPNVFGRIASLSGSFFVSLDQMIDTINQSHLEDIQHIYLDTGDQEIAGGKEKDYIESNQKIYHSLVSKCGQERVTFKIIKGGRHSEVDWARRLKSIIEFIF